MVQDGRLYLKLLAELGIIILVLHAPKYRLLGQVSWSLFHDSREWLRLGKVRCGQISYKKTMRDHRVQL